MAYWLIKSEPGCFSIDDLAAAPDRTTGWDGVRNFQARNFLRAMCLGDGLLFYHSVTNPGVVGLAEVAREAYPDATAQDPDSGHFDPRASPEKPLWDMVDVRFVAKFPQPVVRPGAAARSSMEKQPGSDLINQYATAASSFRLGAWLPLSRSWATDRTKARLRAEQDGKPHWRDVFQGASAQTAHFDRALVVPFQAVGLGDGVELAQATLAFLLDRDRPGRDVGRRGRGRDGLAAVGADSFKRRGFRAHGDTPCSGRSRFDRPRPGA